MCLISINSFCVCLYSVSSTISPGDTAEISGDSPVPTNPSEPVLRYMQTQDPMQKKEGILKKNIHIKNKAKMKKRRIKSHKPRRKHEHMKDQREEEVETRLEEEKRRVYEEEELRIEKEMKKQEQEQEQEHEQEENEQEKERSEEEEDTLYGDVFRMLPHFPIPEPSTEIPPLPTGCSVLENTVSCISTKLTHIPVIRDEELTSIELEGEDFLKIHWKYIKSALYPNETQNSVQRH